ncbi:MAG: hypothetical protein GWO87_01745 [Xanthomonadaceae bacterium]|nr:hypothetical protein [Rhodospirillaceae bacterium]NIA17893.1 hypothetical protein [Xanthomonadaceae bacterium]
MLKLENLKLKIAYWIVSYKIFVKKLSLIILILIDASLVSFSAVKLTQFYSSDKVTFDKTMSQIISNNIDYKTYKRKNKPENIRTTEVDAIALNDNKYNFVAKVQNPNKIKWVAKEVEYYFIYNDLKTKPKKTFILPGEKKYVANFNIKSEQKIFKPKLVISNVQWRRIKKADEKKFADKIKKYINFKIKNAKFLNAHLLGIKNDDEINAINFEFKNNAPFDYYEVGFYIATYNGPSITSINYFLANDILSKEQKKIEIRWHTSIPSPDKIIIIPEINILDNDIVMKKDNIIGFPK